MNDQVVDHSNGLWKKPIQTLERDMVKLEKEMDWQFKCRIDVVCDDFKEILMAKHSGEYHLLEFKVRVHFATDRTEAKVFVVLVGERNRKAKK